jgi:hypothetical protein
MFSIKAKYSNIRAIIFFLLFFILIPIASCKDNAKQSGKEQSNKIGIVIIDKTILRIDPMLYSSVIGFINKGEIALLLNKSKEKLKVGNSENFWYNVRFPGGITGWIYGSNLKIFPADNSREIEKFLRDLWNVELEKFRKRLAGTWESVAVEGVPGQSLEISDDGQYKSYHDESKAIEGEYSLNFREREIIFKNGTYFGNKITFFVSNSGNYLRKSANDAGIKFIKSSLKIKSTGDEKKKDGKSGA